MSVLLEASLFIFILNLPFGVWRGKVRKLSFQWFLAVHSSIPLIIWIRIKLGLGWEWTTYPFLIAAFFAGQWLGSTLARRLYIVYFPRKRRV